MAPFPFFRAMAAGGLLVVGLVWLLERGQGEGTLGVCSSGGTGRVAARLITPDMAGRIPVEWAYGKDHWAAVDLRPVPPFRINTHDPVAQDVFISGSVHRGEAWDPFIWDLFVRLLSERAGVAVVDVGANLGYFSLMAAAMGCRVVAFEPMNRNVAKFVSSIARNRFETRIALYHNAVGDEPGRVVRVVETHATNQGNGHITRIGGPARGIYGQDFVETVRLDDVLDVMEVELLKIDVEGLEGAVLNGARRLLCWGIVHYIVLEFSHETRQSQACPPAGLLGGLERLGYAVSDVVQGSPRLSAAEWSAFPPNLLLTLQNATMPPGVRLAGTESPC